MPTKITHAYFRLSTCLVVVALISSGALLSQCTTPEEHYSDNPDSLFVQVIIPLLERECEGCHFSGGEVYGLLPFDESLAILDRVDEILVRLEDRDRKPLEHWKHLHTAPKP